MTTLHGTILALSTERGSKIAYSLQRESGEYRSVTATDYRETTLRFSQYLNSLGISPGDRVVLLSENGPEWTMAALAILNLGALVVPVASIASALEIRNTLAEAGPRLVILSRHLAAFRAVTDFLEAEGIAFLVWDLQTEQPLGEFVSGQVPAAINESMGADAVALLIYTSGTTGHPKGVPITHGNVLFDARAVLQVLEASERDRLVSVLPLSHLFEFTGGYVVPSLIGASITYVKSLKAEDLLSAMRDTQATALVGVPLLFEVIARNLQAKLDGLPGPLPRLFAWFTSLTKANPSLGPWLFYPVHRALGGHLRFFIAGGSRLQPAVYEFFRGLGLPLLQGYGLTETAPVLSVTNLATAGPEHVGAPLPGVEVGIFDDLAQRLDPGREGEIWARGPNVFRGYLDPSHNQGVFHGDWFRTGDLGSFDAKGMLRITGRRKDLIVTPAGKNVYPEEIEETVLASGLFLEACALGLQDAAGHEKVGLVVVPDRAGFPGMGLEEIRRAAIEKAAALCRPLAEYKWPQRLEAVFEELPKTSTRKVKKHEVRKLLAERDRMGQAASEGKPADGLNPGSELESAIAAGISSITGMDVSAIRLSDSLTKNLGLDSLTFVELLSHVEKKFNTRIEGVDFSTIQTVKDLAAALEFTVGPAKKAGFFSRVWLANFSPAENSRLLWRLPRRLMNVLLRAYLRIRHGMEVEGWENIRAGGPYVFTPNHSSHFDLLAVAGSVPGSMLHTTFAVAAKDYFFDRNWKALAARIFVNALPFDRRGRVDESMRQCREALTLGGSLVVFPEGTRSPDGTLQDFKPGVGQLLAGHPDALAVPVFIDGAHAIMPKGSHWPGPGKLRIRYGKPISFRGVGNDAESLRRIAERLRAEVAALAPRA